MGWVFDVASFGCIAGSMSSSDSLTGNINVQVAGQAAVTWFEHMSVFCKSSVCWTSDGVFLCQALVSEAVTFAWILNDATLFGACSCTASEVHGGNLGAVYDPYVGRFYRWPEKVILLGLKGDSLDWFDSRQFTRLGLSYVHHNLNMLLPVKYLGFYSLLSCQCDWTLNWTYVLRFDYCSILPMQCPPAWSSEAGQREGT